jgi:hypothetical protein
MTTKIITKSIICLFLTIGFAGCNWAVQTNKPREPAKQTSTSLCESYGPAEIKILPLTEATDDGSQQKISVFVGLLDAFGCSQKWPAVFRFELYERVERSAEPVGRRVKLWPDIDLTEPVKNNKYWQDFLRAYKFSLDIEQSDKQSYILQITCILASEKRLTAQIPIKPVIQKNTPP